MEPLTAPVFDVQRFSIHDGPGIRSLVFFKGCNLACAWCQNPESQQVAPLISFYASRCQDNGACLDACPAGAVSLDDFRIVSDRCTMCLKCVEACPNQALKPIGEALTPEALLETLLADRAYYESSGGGVTFSGGEPTLHPRFMDRLLDLCAAENIHTALETCGTFSLARWRPILPKLQLIYFDLKIMDNDAHKAATGVGNARILENAAYLVAQNLPVEFRLTLVPGLTDTPANLAAVAAFLRELGQHRLHVLGYHRMGESKIDIINGSQPKLGLETYSAERLDDIRGWFDRRGIASPQDA